jgi:hypothetical protein
MVKVVERPPPGEDKGALPTVTLSGLSPGHHKRGRLKHTAGKSYDTHRRRLRYADSALKEVSREGISARKLGIDGCQDPGIRLDGHVPCDSGILPRSLIFCISETSL